MPESTTRGLGLALAVAYAAFIGWLLMRQPQTIAQTGRTADGMSTSPSAAPGDTASQAL